MSTSRVRVRARVCVKTVTVHHDHNFTSIFKVISTEITFNWCLSACFAMSRLHSYRMCARSLSRYLWRYHSLIIFVSCQWVMFGFDNKMLGFYFAVYFDRWQTPMNEYLIRCAARILINCVLGWWSVISEDAFCSFSKFIHSNVGCRASLQQSRRRMHRILFVFFCLNEVRHLTNVFQFNCVQTTQMMKRTVRHSCTLKQVVLRTAFVHAIMLIAHFTIILYRWCWCISRVQPCGCVPKYRI